MIRQMSRYLASLVLALSALAFAAAGSAHHVPQPEDLAAEFILLLGGDDFCGTQPQMMRGEDCPLCHLPGAMPEPAPVAGGQPADYCPVADRFSARENLRPARVRDPGHGMRAPPVLL